MDELDPYVAPSATLATPATPAARSRWAALRYLPIIPCGVVVLLCALQVVITTAVVLSQGPAEWGRMPGATLAFALATDLVQLAMLSLGIVAIRRWWACRWAPAAVMSVVLIVAYAAFVAIVVGAGPR